MRPVLASAHVRMHTFTTVGSQGRVDFAMSSLILLAVLLSLAEGATTYGFDEIPNDPSMWKNLISYFMESAPQSSEPEIGKCGDRCYVVSGQEKIILKEGMEYTRPDEPCYKYLCTSNGVIQETISCPSTDALEPCPNSGRVVRLPEQCCADCEKPKPPEDIFHEWGEWTPCSRTCGGGRQARRRECIIAANGTRVNCVGERLQIQDCNAQRCTYKCVWKEWSDWHSCSVTCGYGTEIRTREPISAIYEGRNCEAPSMQYRLCEREKCLDSSCPSDKTVCDGNCIPDMDHDCIHDDMDNCRMVHNTEQLDNDEDGIGNECDNCEDEKNLDQSDNDDDKEGDACDDDDDNDLIIDTLDNCRFIANVKQLKSEKQKYATECNTTGNGIIIEYDQMTAAEKKERLAEIMQLMIKLYSDK